MVTLHEMLSNTDDLCQWARNEETTFEVDKIPSTIISKYQRQQISDYENNPVLSDALNGRQSIEKSLLELARVYEGIRKFLPRRENKAHNERLDQMGELVTLPEHLRTYGLWAPDNAVNGAILGAGVCFGISYAITSSFLLLNSKEHLLISALASVICGPFLGVMTHRYRNGELPLDQAQYLDRKITELYPSP